MRSETRLKETEIGNIPEDWDVKRIKDLVSINALTINKSYPYTEISYFDISSVHNGRILGSQRLLLKDAPSRAKRIVRDNDILFSTVRPNLKHFAFARHAKPNTVASTGFAVITAKNIVPEFLYCYLSTNRFTDYLTAIADAHTSTYPSFNPDVIENSYVPFPPDDEQKAIAKILCDLDLKIELSHQLNKTLEAIGQTLFKRWFIDFDFPNEEGKPYKSSGGEMVDSELGETPKGWRIGVLSDIAVVIDCLHSKKPNRQDSGQYLLQVYNIGVDGRLDLSKLYFVANDDYKKWTKRISVKNGDLVISKTGRVGAVAQMLEGFEAGMGRNLVCIRHMKSKSLPAFLKEYLLCPSMKREIGIKTHLGTVLKSLHVKEIEKLRTILPPYEIIKKFEELARPFQKLVNMNIKSNLNLIQIRDSLLPRLMSGRSRVSIG